MFGIVTTFLAGPYGLLLKIGTIMLIIGAIWFAGARFEHNRLKPKIAALEADAALWEQTAETRLRMMQVQNKAVEGLRAAQEEKLRIRDEKLAKARMEADKWRDSAERKAEILARLELPENECTALTVLIDEARK